MKDPPAATHAGCSFSSTCSGGSAGRKKEAGQDGMQSQQRPPPRPGLARSLAPQRSRASAGRGEEAVWGLACSSIRRGRRKQFRVKDGLAGSFTNMVFSGMDKNGGGQGSTKRRSRNCAANQKQNIWICLLLLQKSNTNFHIKPRDDCIETKKGVLTGTGPRVVGASLKGWGLESDLPCLVRPAIPYLLNWALSGALDSLSN